MTSLGLNISGTPVVVIPDNTPVIPVNHPVVSGGYGQGVAVIQVPANVPWHGRGDPNLPSAPIILQNPPGMSHLSNAPTVIPNPSVVIQNPIRMVTPQNPPMEALNITGTTTLQNSPMVNQNPTMLTPETTHTENQPYWSFSFGNFTTFDIKKFMNEEVKSLGAVQIMTGLIHLFLGSVSLYVERTTLGNSGYPYWGGLSFIVSGSLSILAAKEPHLCMVRGSVGMNIVSAIFSIAGILVLIGDLILTGSRGLNNFVSSVLLLFSLLECVITCVATHFGCEATGWNNWSTMILPNMFNAGSTMASTLQQGFPPSGGCPEPLPPEGEKTPQMPGSGEPRS